jgi:hypothetical protein
VSIKIVCYYISGDNCLEITIFETEIHFNMYIFYIFSINPKMNVLASCSGQRHYPDLGDSGDSDNDSVDNNVNTKDNSVKLWKFKS